MPYIRVKQKFQVTIPASIRKKVDIHEGDTLEATEQDGKIVLIPQELRERSKSSGSSLISLLGVKENSGLYGSAKDADDYLRQLRDEWK